MKIKLQSFASALTAMGIALTFATPVFADTLASDANHAAKTDYKLTVQQAEANYKTTKAGCDARHGNDKDVCLKDAQATYESAKADAKAMRKTEDAFTDADKDKRDAHYKVAKEQCQSLAGNAKDACVERAKATFAQ
ncbi:MAG: cell envelope biogenesis protein TolA [Pseudomonadota bacterium]